MIQHEVYRKRSTLRRLSAALLAAVLAAAAAGLSLPPAASAASIEVTDALKKSFDRTAAAADPALRTRLEAQYAKLLTARSQRENWENTVKKAHYANDEQEAAIRRSLREVDANKLKELERQIEQAKRAAEPIDQLYASVNRMADLARSAGQKELAKQYRSRAEAIKPAVQLARQEIRRKQDALKAAKKARTDKVNRIRTVLAEREKLDARIKAERTALTSPSRRIGEEWKNFKAAVKAQDAARTSSALSKLIADHETIVNVHQRIHNHERSIGAVLDRASAMLAAR